MTFDKERAKELQEDFIPNGKEVNNEEFSGLEFRKTLDNEVYQCTTQVDYDIQSGPIFCGKIAEYIAPVEDGRRVLPLCTRHANAIQYCNKSLKKSISP